MSNAELIAGGRKLAERFNDAGLRYGVADTLNALADTLEATDKNLQDALDDRAGWKHSGGELIRQKTELLAENQRLRAVINHAATVEGFEDHFVGLLADFRQARCVPSLSPRTSPVDRTTDP